MTKTANRRRQVIMPISIKKKLSAAICMLLVAVIMMISSTYAWFTLSTAPEVKGITTNVGANGNLEMALLSGSAFYSDEDDLGIISNIGDSMAVENKDVTESNATWGNLVDLSALAYGLSGVTLLPGALNVSETTLDDVTTRTINGTSPLLGPLYGSDGRVISVSKNTLLGKKDTTNILPISNFEDESNGVSMVGTSSGMTERMSAYRDALSAALTNINSARNKAQNMLETYGSDIATIFIKIASDSNQTTTFTKEEVETLGSMLSGLEAANSDVFTAIKKIAIASTLSDANSAVELTDEEVVAFVNAANTAATPAALADVTNMRTFTDETNVAITNYNTTASRLSSARTTYNGFGLDTNNGPFGYTAVKGLVDHLINKQYVTVAGVQNPTSANKQQLIDAATSGTAVPIVLLEGSGALYDIAKSAGNYQASGIEADVDNSGLIVHVRVSISTEAGEPILLTAARDQAIADESPLNSEGGNGKMDNIYGYVIDFGFRTNAPTGSKLLLQDTAAQRVYADSQNALTQGGGTYVEFESTADTFTVDDVRALLSALRIVFTNPVIDDDGVVSYEIIAIAAPDITATTDNNGVTTYTGGTVTGSKLKVGLAFYAFTLTEADDGGMIVTLGAKKIKGEGEDAVNDLELTTLTQNVAAKISTIIYFDGDAIDNTMAANAATSMTGIVNLQFATDAELTPMENAALRSGEENNNNNTQTPKTVREKLQDAVNYIKAHDIYTTATAKEEAARSEEEAALIAAVAAAEDAIADTDAEDSELTAAGTTLATAFAAAGASITDAAALYALIN